MNKPEAISGTQYLKSKGPFRVELHGLEPVFPDLEQALSNSERRKDFNRFRRQTGHWPKRTGDTTAVSKPIRHFFQLGTQLQNTGEMLRIFVRAVGPLVFYFVYRRNSAEEEFHLVSLPTVYLEKEGSEKHWTEPFYFHMAYLTDRAGPDAEPAIRQAAIEQIKRSMWCKIDKRYWELQADVALTKRDGTIWHFTCESTLVLRGENNQRMIRIGPEALGEPGKFLQRLHHARLLVASPLVQSAICRLAQVWHNPSLRNVLVIAPPGSGKEVLVKFLRAGFEEKTHRGDRPVAAAASQQKAGQEKYTFSLPNAANVEELREFICKSTVSLRTSIPVGTHTGNAEASDNKGDEARTNPIILFFDEVDKASEAIRGSLLRILEERELECDGVRSTLGAEASQQPKRVIADLKDAIFIFASSTPFEDLLSGRAPRDFWTRMQLTVEMGHPFLVGSETDLEQVLEQYVRMFLNDMLLINEEKLKTREKIRRLYGLGDESLKKVLRPFLYDPVSLQEGLSVQPVHPQVIEAIAKPLCRMCLVRTPSVRVVRTISERVFWELLAHGLLGIEEQGVQDLSFDRDPEVVRREIEAWCEQKVPTLFLEAYS